MIKTDLSKCTGCRMCETACSFAHGGEINRHRSRIHVMHLYQSGVDGPVVCLQCKERHCMACPADALTTGPLGQVMVSPTTCTLCGLCERNCPVGAIHLFNEIVHVCDLCGGSPRCVPACTEGAIEFVPGEGERLSLEQEKAGSKGLNTSQRRARYIETLGRVLRDAWRKKS